MPVAKAAAAEATVTAPKYPSGISVEKTLEKIKLWGKGTEEGGCTDLIWYLGMGIMQCIVQLRTCTFCVLQVHAVRNYWGSVVGDFIGCPHHPMNYETFSLYFK